MPQEHSWERVGEDDPNRCQGVIPSRGQCFNKAMEGSTFCPAHGGNRGAKQAKDDSKRLYRLQQWNERIAHVEDHAKLKSLGSEIGILRMILESKLKMCTDETQLLLESTAISDLVVKIEKLVTSCNRLDLQLSNMLDSTQAMKWVGDILEILDRHITDKDVLSVISDELLDSFTRVQKGES